MLQENCMVVLVYFNFRGLAQIVRHLLCYLNVSFVDVLLDCLDEQRKALPKPVLEALKGAKIESSKLPVLVHEGQVIEQLYPILTYLCYRFSRQDLLGKDIFQKVRVQQLLEILDQRLPQTHSSLFEFSGQAQALPEEELLPTIDSRYRETLKNSGYMKEFSDILLKDGKRQYLLGTPTLIDFYFLQNTAYMLGIFGRLEREGEGGRKKGRVRYLRVMQSFRQFMQGLEYYLKNREYLQSFAVVGSRMSASIVKGISRIWSCSDICLFR